MNVIYTIIKNLNMQSRKVRILSSSPGSRELEGASTPTLIITMFWTYYRANFIEQLPVLKSNKREQCAGRKEVNTGSFGVTWCINKCVVKLVQMTNWQMAEVCIWTKEHGNVTRGHRCWSTPHPFQGTHHQISLGVHRKDQDEP